MTPGNNYGFSRLQWWFSLRVGKPRAVDEDQRALFSDAWLFDAVIEGSAGPGRLLEAAREADLEPVMVPPRQSESGT